MHIAEIQQRKSNQQSFAITTSLLALLLITLIFLKLQHPPVEIPISAVLIDFGDNQEEGMGNNNPNPGGESSATPQEIPQKSSPAPKPAATVKTSSTVTTPSKEIIAEDPNAVAIRKQQKEWEAKQKQIAESVKKAEAERVAREKAEQEARDKVAGVFKSGKNGTGNGNGSGSGTGNGSGPSGTGNNSGPGSGSSGSGPGSGPGHDFSARILKSRPPVVDHSQVTGDVRILITVDRSGNVIFAQYTQKGSTITDLGLIKKAEQAARDTKFNADPAAEEEQKGYITIHFKY